MVEENVTVDAKPDNKKLVNIKMESSLIKVFHACNLGLNFQLNKHQLRTQNVVSYCYLIITICCYRTFHHKMCGIYCILGHMENATRSILARGLLAHFREKLSQCFEADCCYRNAHSKKAGAKK